MNIVFSVRIFLASLTMITLILLPRVLYYFELRVSELDTLLTPWATFLAIFFASILLTYPLLKNIRTAIFVLIGIILVASILTIYFCQLSLPW